MPTTSITGLLIVEYNRFTLATAGAPPGCLDLPPNGLLGVPAESRPFEEGTVAVVATGVSSDAVHITAETWPAQPPTDLSSWQDAGVITLDWPGGPASLLGEDASPPAELPLGADLPAGRYALLVAGTNRDEGEARSEGMPVETYLIQLWPAADDQPHELVLKATSATTALWRQPPPPRIVVQPRAVGGGDGAGSVGVHQVLGRLPGLRCPAGVSRSSSHIGDDAR
ncbi:hypothetical protein [Streptomyces sp. NPDC050485]|uniref:hypothetical protein n=1 Tax=Streptomyces sp. NPDC050485 TaxID=3365617 RepID=UPI0037AB6DE6